MNILMVTADWFPTMGGVPLHCTEIGDILEERGNKIIYLVSSRKNLDMKGKKVYTVKTIVKLLNRNQICIGVRKTLLEILEKEKIDVIILFSYMFELNFRVLFWLRFMNIKIPTVLYYLGSLENDVVNYLPLTTRLAKNIYDNTIARYLFIKSDLIYSNSEPTIKMIANKYHISIDKIYYIPNFIDKSIKLETKKGMYKTIIFIGRLTQNKGIYFIPKIVKSIPTDWKFIIIGDGPIQYIPILLEKEHSNFKWIKRVEHDIIFKYLLKSDILVLPSYAEGSPRVCLEASMVGVPSIAYDVGDVRNTILNSNEFVINKFDEDLFIKKLILLINNYHSYDFNSDIIKIRNKFGYNNVIDNFIKPIIEIIGGNNENINLRD